MSPEDTQVLTVQRKRYGGTLLFVDGVNVGHITAGNKRGFGLYLRGIYWTRTGPNRRGGTSGKSFLRLKDAIASAQKVLSEQDKPHD